MNHDQQLVVAVKVFNLQTRGAFKSFDAECETMRCVRHRNLLKVLTVCSSTDFRGDDFKALIYEFLPKEICMNVCTCIQRGKVKTGC